jgi:hypothetical protein
MKIWSSRKWPAERAQRAETACNNPHAGFINDIKRLGTSTAASFRRFGERSWAETGGNLARATIRISLFDPRGALQTLDADAFSAGGMGVAAMQYE